MHARTIVSRDCAHEHRKPSCRGIESKYQKLTIDDVVAIRKRHAPDKKSRQALAKEYRVAYSTISNIVLNRTWKDLDGAGD